VEFQRKKKKERKTQIFSLPEEEREARLSWKGPKNFRVTKGTGAVTWAKEKKKTNPLKAEGGERWSKGKEENLEFEGKCVCG